MPPRARETPKRRFWAASTRLGGPLTPSSAAPPHSRWGVWPRPPRAALRLSSSQAVPQSGGRGLTDYSSVSSRKRALPDMGFPGGPYCSLFLPPQGHGQPSSWLGDVEETCGPARSSLDSLAASPAYSLSVPLAICLHTLPSRTFPGRCPVGNRRPKGPGVGG